MRDAVCECAVTSGGRCVVMFYGVYDAVRSAYVNDKKVDSESMEVFL